MLFAFQRMLLNTKENEETAFYKFNQRSCRIYFFWSSCKNNDKSKNLKGLSHSFNMFLLCACFKWGESMKAFLFVCIRGNDGLGCYQWLVVPLNCWALWGDVILMRMRNEKKTQKMWKKRRKSNKKTRGPTCILQRERLERDCRMHQPTLTSRKLGDWRSCSHWNPWCPISPSGLFF